MHIVFLNLMKLGPISLGSWLPLLIPLALLELLLVVVALVDLIRREPRRVRGNKWLWVLVILLIGTLGPICYLIAGRKEAEDDFRS
ncbi:MAG: PLD nuclease N-terminal domain-containing protein [Ktedonobacteraceae bacterium]